MGGGVFPLAHQRRIVAMVLGLFWLAVDQSVWAQSSPVLIITEIMANPRGSDADHEWIEVFNPSARSVAVNSFRFRENGENHKIPDCVVPPRSFLILTPNRAAFLTRHAAMSSTAVQVAFSLSNGGERLELLRGTNYPLDCIDSVDYSATGFPAIVEGRSLHLRSQTPPCQANQNDAGAAWATAQEGDRLSWPSGGDTANPGAALWSLLRTLVFFR